MGSDATISRLKVITPDGFEALMRQHIRYTFMSRPDRVNSTEMYRALALSVRDLLVDRALETTERYERCKGKHVAYLSLEFLMGRALGNSLIALGIYDMVSGVVGKLGGDLDELLEEEPDAALGNGGLGRLAACFLDSMATLGIPGYGFGINYEYGLFRQTIVDGYQREQPDHWLESASPWEIERSTEAIAVPLYGRVMTGHDANGQYRAVWVDFQTVLGIPFDMPIPGFGGHNVNALRLYTARASNEFDMAIFNSGDYLQAVHNKVASETISKVLYPSDTVDAGRELRLVQEYFLVACSLNDIIARFRVGDVQWDDLPNRVAIQLNDTHPSLAVVELMRILVDENDVEWERAWKITTATCGYTNHTLLPEALEKWPVSLLEKVLPRHTQIIFEINRRFLDEVKTKFPGDGARLERMTLLEQDGDRKVRMAHLAVVGSHSINGVAELHTKLLKANVMRDFTEMFPDRFNNKTNGVTQRRFLLKANPSLAELVTKVIGPVWITDFEQIRGLEARVDDEDFLSDLMKAKRINKARAQLSIGRAADSFVSLDALFDVQAKRIHEYKRQLLAVMHIMHRYLRLVEDGVTPKVPRVFVFAGKAAPGYQAAKLIIKLINSVAQVVNHDPKAKDKLLVSFLPDYRVSLAEILIPAADLSEQISTAGMEASGTGNMKFAMNGALTICTLDGANIEMREEVGADNIYVFGLRAEEISELKNSGSYQAHEIYEKSDAVKRVLDSIASDRWSPGNPDMFKSIHDEILYHGDRYFNAADLDSYIKMQEQVDVEYAQPMLWARKCLLNIARMGKFSSDRTIRQYSQDIWNVKPCL